MTGLSGKKTTQTGNETGPTHLQHPGMGVEAQGEWKDRLSKKHPSWKEVLNKVKAGPGKKAKDLY